MAVSVVQGLTSAEAAERLEAERPEPVAETQAAVRPAPCPRPTVQFFALMLWVAGALALVAGLPQLAVAVFAVIVVNAVFAFVQEHRADRAAERLQRPAAVAGHRRRDGVSGRIDAAELVVGDLAHARAPATASGRRRGAHPLGTARSTRRCSPVRASPSAQAAERRRALRRHVRGRGRGRAVVTATGARTRLAEHRAADDHRRPTPDTR